MGYRGRKKKKKVSVSDASTTQASFLSPPGPDTLPPVQPHVTATDNLEALPDFPPSPQLCDRVQRPSSARSNNRQHVPPQRSISASSSPRRRSSGGGSILKNTDALHGGVRRSSRESPRRKFCFNEDVDVFYYEEGVKPRHVDLSRKDVEKLKRDRLVISGPFVRNDLNEASPLCARPNTIPPEKDRKPPTQKTSPIPLPSSKPLPGVGNTGDAGASGGPVISCDISDCPYTDVKGRQKGLKLMVTLDDSCVKERTTVRALSGGTSLILVLYRNEASDGGSAIVQQQLNPVPLPQAVDPYRVKAQLHKTGELEINAPLRDKV